MRRYCIPLLIILSACNAPTTPAQTKPSAAEPVDLEGFLGSEHPRYQLVGVQGEVYLLDTAKGAVWQKYNNGKDAFFSLIGFGDVKGRSDGHNTALGDLKFQGNYYFSKGINLKKFARFKGLVENETGMTFEEWMKGYASSEAPSTQKAKPGIRPDGSIDFSDLGGTPSKPAK